MLPPLLRPSVQPVMAERAAVAGVMLAAVEQQPSMNMTKVKSGRVCIRLARKAMLAAVMGL